MATNNFENYWQLRVEGAMARLKAVLEVIKHNPTRGAVAENALRDLLAEFLPHRWGIGGGFILEPNGQSSRQVDILLFDQLSASPIYRDGNLLVLTPTVARVAIEVKSDLSKSEVPDTFENIRTVKQSDPSSQGLIFAYRGVQADTLRKHIKRRLRAEKKAAKYNWKLLPDAIYILEHDLVVLRAAEGEAHNYAAYESGVPIIRHLFTRVLSELKLTNLQAFVETDKLGNQLFNV